MKDIAIELAQKLGDLEEEVKIALVNAIGKSDTVSKHVQALCIKVNVFGYTELAVVNGQLTFLDDNGLHYSLMADCTLDDLIEILMDIE